MSTTLKSFFAFAGNPFQVGITIAEAIKKLKIKAPRIELHSWVQNDIAGHCLVDPIIEKISDADFILSDITTLNFNVCYEIGYAIGCKKRVFLVKNSTIEPEYTLIRRVGIFDTLGYESYRNSDELSGLISKISNLTPLSVEGDLNRESPIYIISPREKAEEEIRIVSRLKKISRVPFRIFDPQETGRMSSTEAIDNVTTSTGIIIPLVPVNRQDSVVHNLRCAFIAGLSHALGKETLILQYNNEIVPLDYRDSVSSYSSLDGIDAYISDFASRSVALALKFQRDESHSVRTKLEETPLGAPAAENEMSDLPSYFLATDEFNRVNSGEIQIVAGRKGAGKSALFFQVRNVKRKDKRNIVLDLHPEGFQLKKLKTLVLDRLDEGSKEHTITAFWEYLFLLEICYKILEKDRHRHIHDHVLRPLYEKLRTTYNADRFVTEGDFAERLLKLTTEIESKFLFDEEGVSEGFLPRERVTELLYQHDLSSLRDQVIEYLQEKGQVWILFDNIDKGWPPHGIEESDLTILKCLIEALAKLKNQLRKKDLVFQGVVFIRNDVYEHLLASQSDRGKMSKVVIDWVDADLLREFLRLRLVSKSADRTKTFDLAWRDMVKAHIFGGQESSQYFIDRSLMRPRALLEFIRHCKSHAVNLKKTEIDEDDISYGETAYSVDLIHYVDLEIRDVYPVVDDVLYAFIGCERHLTSTDIESRLKDFGIADNCINDLRDLLIWYGVFGFAEDVDKEIYIYNVNYDFKKLNALIGRRAENDLLYCVNPAFWRGLEINL